jgi:hypothetical protein
MRESEKVIALRGQASFNASAPSRHRYTPLPKYLLHQR